MTELVPEYVVIKFGGSILTDKKAAEATIQKETLHQLAEDLALVVSQNPSLRPIVLHGAGSFGHPLAHRYAINGKSLTPETQHQAKEISDAVGQLNAAVTAALKTAGLPAVCVQTHTAVDEQNGLLRFISPDVIEGILSHGEIPVLSGDVVFSDKQTVQIASADRLATLFATTFDAKTIVFATDVAGVFSSWPPATDAHPLPRITKEEIERFSEPTAEHARDVTGEMQGKLKALLPLQGCRVIIGDGREPGFLSAAFSAAPRGTVIEL